MHHRRLAQSCRSVLAQFGSNLLTMWSPSWSESNHVVHMDMNAWSPSWSETWWRGPTIFDPPVTTMDSIIQPPPVTWRKLRCNEDFKFGDLPIIVTGRRVRSVETGYALEVVQKGHQNCDCMRSHCQIVVLPHHPSMGFFPIPNGVLDLFEGQFLWLNPTLEKAHEGRYLQYGYAVCFTTPS